MIILLFVIIHIADIAYKYGKWDLQNVYTRIIESSAHMHSPNVEACVFYVIYIYIYICKRVKHFSVALRTIHFNAKINKCKMKNITCNTALNYPTIARIAV